MVQERNQWMDIAKGITIILMVLGHTSIPDIASRFIWSFHMPLFFLASGWMTNWRKCSGFGEYLTKKAKGILLPFMVYSAIVLLIFECLSGRGYFEALVDTWLGSLCLVVYTSFVFGLCNRMAGEYVPE